MEVNLYKIRSGWAISVNKELEVYSTIEQAADVLLKLAVQDESIDRAIIELAVNNHSRANFGINGTFIMSDGAHPDELFGIT